MKLRISRVHQHRFVVFVLTFFCYGMFHANRHAFSNVKTSTEKVWTPSHRTGNGSHAVLKPDEIWNTHTMFGDLKSAERFQGVLDLSFMLSYSLGLFLNGYIGDRVDMRYMLTIGTVGMSLANFIFGCVCEWTHFYNVYFYVFIWIVNGLMQSTGWPLVVAVMGNWFGKNSRGVLLGVWSACASVGNIWGALMVASVLQFGYQYAFLMTSSISMSAAIMVFFGLVTSPEDVGYEIPQQDDADDNSFEDKTSIHSSQDGHKESKLNGAFVEDSLDNEKQIKKLEIADTDKEKTGIDTETGDGDRQVQFDIQDTRPASLSFWKACLLPGVIAYSLAYAFLKLVNYSFFFWLPFYLNNALHFAEHEAAKLSTVYDVAGIVGGILGGLISDWIGRRTVVIVPMLLLSVPSLFVYSHSPDNFVANVALMFLVGFFIAGVANMISAAVSADLGCQKQLRGDDKALATVTGVIDGTGSLGAALGQIAVPYLQTDIDWHAVFYLFMACMFMTSVCLAPVLVREIRSLSCCTRCSKSKTYSLT